MLSPLSADRSRKAHSRTVSLPPVLVEFCRNVLLISAVSAIYWVVMGPLLHKEYPYNTPFFIPDVRFSDFTIYIGKFRYFHQAAFFSEGFPFTYPAPYALMFEVFCKFGAPHPLRAFLVFFGLAFTVPAVLFCRALTRHGLSTSGACGLTAVTLLLSWPLLLMFDRANTEVFVWVPLCLGAWAYARGKDWTAAVLFGLAASLKIFPIIFLALFFSRPKYPKLLAGVAACAASTVAALAVLGPTVATANQGISTAMRFWQERYLASYLPNEAGLDHTILAVIKSIVGGAFEVPNGPVLQRISEIYLYSMVTIGLLLYFLVICKLPRLNQFMAISIISIYFTPFSGDGTLIHLYYGFALCCFLVLDAWKRGIEVRGMRGIFLCLAYLFATTGFAVAEEQRFEGQLKCVVLGILLCLVLRTPLGPRFDEAASSGELAFPNASEIAAR